MSEVKILAVGDTLLKTISGDDPFAYIKEMIFKTDLILINLETCLLAKEKIYKNIPEKSVSLRTNQVNLNWLEKYRNKIVFTLANNHVFDFGEEGYNDTISFLKKNNYRYCSIDDYAEIKIKNQKIRIYAIAEQLIHHNTFQKKMLKKPVFEVNNSLKNIVVIHWGREHILIPSLKQIRLANKIFFAGGDIIIGGHSHTPQPLWLLDDKKFVVFSLGNFNMKHYSRKAKTINKISFILKFSLSKKAVNSISQVPIIINSNLQPVINYSILKYIYLNNKLFKLYNNTFFCKILYLLNYRIHFSNSHIFGTIKGGWIPRIKKYGVFHLFEFLKWLTRINTFISFLLLPFYYFSPQSRLLKKINSISIKVFDKEKKNDY